MPVAMCSPIASAERKVGVTVARSLRCAGVATAMNSAATPAMAAPSSTTRVVAMRAPRSMRSACEAPITYDTTVSRSADPTSASSVTAVWRIGGARVVAFMPFCGAPSSFCVFIVVPPFRVLWERAGQRPPSHPDQ